MFLLSIELKNVRSYRNLRLSFRDDNQIDKNAPHKWTYVLGENGTGKSTLLRAIALVTAGSEALRELVDRPEDWIHMGSDHCTIRAELSTAKNELRRVELNIHRGDGFSDLLERNREGLNQLDDALEHTLRNYPVIGYGVNRRSANSSKGFSNAKDMTSFSNPRAQRVATLFNNEARLTPVEQWAMDLEYRRGDEGLKVIRDAFNQLIPHVKFDGIDRENRRLMFKTQDGVVPYQWLSDGYQTIVGWIGDLLFRITETFSNYKDPFKARGVLMLDEIELHLHPLWQRQLADFLSRRLPNFQIIATTHAPLTAHQAGPGELFIVKRNKNTSAPTVTHYEGEPRRLMLHQLLQTPAFGLETLDSGHVEKLREEFKRLRKTKSLSVGQKKKLTEIRATKGVSDS